MSDQTFGSPGVLLVPPPGPGPLAPYFPWIAAAAVVAGFLWADARKDSRGPGAGAAVVAPAVHPNGYPYGPSGPQPAPPAPGPFHPPYPNQNPSPALTPLAQVLAGNPIEAAELAELFAVGAEMVGKSSVPTTEAFRKAYTEAGAAFSEIKGRFPGLAALIDAELERGLGRDVRPLDAAARTQAAAVFNGIADQLRQVR